MGQRYDIAIEIRDLNKSFSVAEGEVKVLKNINLNIEAGKFTIIYGPSGCGKSTLLHTILGLEKPTNGSVTILKKDLYKDYSEDILSEYRKNKIGVVYQQSNWVKALNVLENVALPLSLLGEEDEFSLAKAKRTLELVKMQNWSEYKPTELSSGQQQKVSLARAIITNPEIIIADEPTGNLDFESGEELISLLKNFAENNSKTILMVTHDLEYLKNADIAIRLFDGQIQKVFSPKEDTLEMNNIYKKFKTYEKR